MTRDPHAPASRGARVFLLLLPLSACFAPPAPQAANVAPEPPGVPRARTPEGPFEGMYSWIARDSAPLGLGRLHPERSDGYGGQWTRSIALPLHSAPDGEPWGWIVRGWLVEGDETRPFETKGTVETAYEEHSFIVEEERGAWLRIRFGAPDERDDGLAWVSRDHLALGPIALFYQPWTELFLTDLIGPQFFRGAGPWLVYDAPDLQAGTTGIAQRDHAIDALEVRGEWLRVRVKQPSDYCKDPPEIRVTEGWIRWWGPARGTEIWYNTRGC